MVICEKCGKEHDGSYGSGRFCCATCARTYSNTFVTPEGRLNQIKALTDEENKKKSLEARDNPEFKAKRYNSNKNGSKGMKKEKRYTNMSSKKIGAIGEFETAKRFTQRGIPVYLALTDDSGTDMIAEFDGKLQKIQVKTTQIQKIKNENDMGYIEFDLTRNIYDHGHILKGRYSSDDVDYFSLYDAINDNLFLIKNTESVTGSLSLRYSEPASINQYKCFMAHDYEFDSVINNIEQGISQDKDDIIDI